MTSDEFRGVLKNLVENLNMPGPHRMKLFLSNGNESAIGAVELVAIDNFASKPVFRVMNGALVQYYTLEDVIGVQPVQ